MAGTDEFRKMDEEWGDKMEKVFGPTLLGFPEGVDSSRLYMFSSNEKQFLTMMNPDVPHILTGYENIFGKYSHAYKKMEGTWEVKKIIPKYEGKHVYAMFLYNAETDTWDVIEKAIAENLTEKFGFAYNTSKMDSLREGDTVQNEVLYKSTSYDEHMQYRIGKNARVMYVTDNATIEDAIKLRRGWAKDVQSVEVDEVRVSVNSNDILKNVYGAPGEYKCFPEVGEYVKNSTVCAVARVNLNHAIFDFQDKRLRTISDTDTEYFAPKNSLIYDIDVCYNGDDPFPENVFYQQLKKYYDQECQYAAQVSEMCRMIESSGSRYTPQVSYLNAKYQRFNDKEYKWKDKDRAFANLVVIFKTIAVVDLEEGFKLTGRYGDKGIISKITNAGEKFGMKPAESFNHIVDNIVDQLSEDSNPETMTENAKEVSIVDDCDMPYYVTEDGEKVVADILLNSSGSIRRLNTDQLYEVEINFIAEQLQRKIKKMTDIEDKMQVILRFLELLNLEQHDFFLQMWNSWDQKFDVDGIQVEIVDEEAKKNFIQDVEENGFYIVKRPDSKMRYDCLRKIYDEWPDIKPYDAYIDLFGIKGKKIMRPVVIGSKYMYLLKQTSNKNFSARSTGRTDKKQVPAKSNDKKSNLSPYSRSPIKIGETHNLFAAVSGLTIAEHNLFTRSSPIARKSLDRILKASGDPFDIQKLKVEENFTNINVDILAAYLKGMGIELDFDVEGEYEYVYRDTIRQYRTHGFTVVDRLSRKPVYDKLFDLYNEFMDTYEVVSSDKEAPMKAAWKWVFEQEEVKKLDLGSITEEMMFMITSKMHDDTLKESSEEARDETADEDTVSKSVTEEE